ncbi:hypothetical protein ACLOJK_037234, partial [Asimina triloba]
DGEEGEGGFDGGRQLRKGVGGERVEALRRWIDGEEGELGFDGGRLLGMEKEGQTETEGRKNDGRRWGESDLGEEERRMGGDGRRRRRTGRNNVGKGEEEQWTDGEERRRR